jgi:hypothetical protein
MSLAQFDEVIPLNVVFRWQPATSIAVTALTVSAAAPWRLDAILLTNTDTVDHKVSFWAGVGGVSYLIGSVNVPTLTGTAGTPPVDAVDTVFNNAIQGYLCVANSTLSVSLDVAPNTSKEVDLLGLGGQL